MDEAADRRSTATGTGKHQSAVIEGGLGLGVSGWHLTRMLAKVSELGAVSRVALDTRIALSDVDLAE